MLHIDSTTESGRSLRGQYDYYYYYYYYYVRLTAFFSRTTWVSQHQKGKPFWILLEQEMMGVKWHQQIICTSLQTHNHASTSPLSFYWWDALPDAQPTASKHYIVFWEFGFHKNKKYFSLLP